MSKNKKMQKNNNSKDAVDYPLKTSMLLIDTLEKRRDQIINKSTVCLAAVSGLLVVEFEFLKTNSNNHSLSKYILIFGIYFSLRGLMKSFDLVKSLKIRKSKKANKVQLDHIFHFANIAQNGQEKLWNKLNNIDRNEAIYQMSKQCYSLSKHLVCRYTALKASYEYFTISLIALCTYILFEYVFVLLQ